MDTVVVTGYGPFKQFSVNASWEAVRLLPKFDFKNFGVNLLTREIPVAYQDVLKTVGELWKLQPTLMIHVGVSSVVKNLTLETIGHKNGYNKGDIYGLVPVDGSCSFGENNREVIETGIDVRNICTQINDKGENIETSVSADAGRFLCEFIFYSSLTFNRDRTIFVHVPDVGKPYTAEQCAEGLKNIILLCLEQVRRLPK